MAEETKSDLIFALGKTWVPEAKYKRIEALYEEAVKGLEIAVAAVVKAPGCQHRMREDEGCLCEMCENRPGGPDDPEESS